MRYVSVFSGVEAATVAWEPLGWEPVAFCEVDAFPSAVLAERFPDVPNLGDITKVDWEEFKSDHGTVDLVVGGSPCQSFSVAGKREGLSGASGLMWEYVRAVRELRPRWFVWENVPGALSSEGGEAFRCLLASMDELGYQCCWRVLDAQFFGVAQRRRRVFLVGSLGDGRAAEVLFEPDGLRWDFEASRDKRKALAARAEGGAGGSRTLQVRCGCAGGGKGALIQEDVSATLSCSNVQTLFQPMGMSYKASSTAQKFPVEIELQPTLTAGRHDAAVMYASGFKYHQGSGAGNIGFENEQSPTLTADGHHPPAIVAFAENQRGEVRLQGGDGDVFGALPCSWSAKQVQAVAVQSTVVIDRAAYNQGVNAQYPPHIELVDVMDTLVARGPHAVAYQAVDC